MAKAQCNCGAIVLDVPERSELVVACHCLECQRRTGAPFGIGAYYAVGDVTISGTAKEYCREGASGGKFRSYFCADCGSTVFWKADKVPAMIGVAVGALADPAFRLPDRSVFERSKHHWVAIDAAAVHFPAGSFSAASNDAAS